jgi:alcohol dehydrogenase (cytochrome c)
VAILSGVGGWSGAIANAELDPRVRNGALGFIGATQDLPAYTLGGSTLLVFAIPQNVLQQAAIRPTQTLPSSGKVEGAPATVPDTERMEFGR